MENKFTPELIAKAKEAKNPDELMSLAKENGMELTVAGTKGHGVLEGLLMGSVTRNLVSLSPIPILVVKD